MLFYKQQKQKKWLLSLAVKFSNINIPILAAFLVICLSCINLMSKLLFMFLSDRVNAYKVNNQCILTTYFSMNVTHSNHKIKCKTPLINMSYFSCTVAVFFQDTSCNFLSFHSKIFNSYNFNYF